MFGGNRRELKLFQSEYPGGGAVPTDQWNIMVCAADTNRDGRMGIDEFKDVYRRLQSGDYSVINEAGARCAGCSSLAINLIMVILACLMLLIWF